MENPGHGLQAGSATELWQALVRDGERRAGTELDEHSESWLVFTLMRHLGNAGLAEPAMALEYLQALHQRGRLRSLALQDVGERCLLIAGLYPELAERRRVGPGYYVELGRGAFQQLAAEAGQGLADLYARLARQFLRLVRILLALRAQDASTRGVSPLQQYAVSLAAGEPWELAFPGALPVAACGRA